MHGIFKAVSEGDIEINPKGLSAPHQDAHVRNIKEVSLLMSKVLVQAGQLSQISERSTQHKCGWWSIASAPRCWNGK